MSVSLKAIDAGVKYDLVLATCGYESRATAVLRHARIAAARKVAWGYGSHEVLAFDANRESFDKAGYAVSAISELDFETAFRHELQRGARRLFVDISCMTRARLAALVQVCAEIGEVDVDFWYSMAMYTPPSKDDNVHQYVRPVSAFFAGWSGATDRPSAVVAGLGYEYMRAIGVLELLDATDAWLYFPRSPLKKYDVAVADANALLLEQADRSRVIEYRVDDLYGLCQSLFSLVGSVRQTHRCSLLPLGPKPFALACLLCGVTFSDVSVWRISAGDFAAPLDKRSTSRSFGLRVYFEGTMLR